MRTNSCVASLHICPSVPDAFASCPNTFWQVAALWGLPFSGVNLNKADHPLPGTRSQFQLRFDQRPFTVLQMKMTLTALFLSAALFARAEDPIRPDPKLTPGAVMTNVTVEQIMQKGYANKLNGGVRHVTAAEKKQIFTEYFGKVPGIKGHYEIDHLISLELGGSNDPKNLWPESYYT